jgi:hypothetical protein
MQQSRARQAVECISSDCSFSLSDLVFVLVGYKYPFDVLFTHELTVLYMCQRICVLAPVDDLPIMSSYERTKHRCAVCDVVEELPEVELYRCKDHRELRCKRCIRQRLHAAAPPPIFSSVNNAETCIIDFVLEQKEINGSKIRITHSLYSLINSLLQR